MTLSYQLKKPVDVIFEFLTDMQKFVIVHPVITKIDTLGNNNYLVHETLKLAFIPISFTYPVSLESSLDDKKIIIRATVMKLNKIEMSFTISSNDNFTLVEENIQFKSLFPIKRIMQYIFKKQHALLFKNIELHQ